MGQSLNKDTKKGAFAEENLPYIFLLGSSIAGFLFIFYLASYLLQLVFILFLIFLVWAFFHPEMLPSTKEQKENQPAPSYFRAAMNSLKEKKYIDIGE